MQPGESEEAAVQRELAEEAGYEAERLVKLCAFDSSKSVMDERANIYLAEGLRPVIARSRTRRSSSRCAPSPSTRCCGWWSASEIVDAMTVVAVLHAARRR